MDNVTLALNLTSRDIRNSAGSGLGVPDRKRAKRLSPQGSPIYV